MVPVAPSRMLWSVLRCPSKQGISSLCCSRAFSACWVGEVSTQYLFRLNISRLFSCMPLGFIARGYGLVAPSARSSWATFSVCSSDTLLACALASVGQFLRLWFFKEGFSV